MKFPVKGVAFVGMLAAYAVAQAQSSVTMFGVVDLTFGRYTASGAGSRTALDTDGNTSSRLGLRGVEDIGGGLKAGFWLESSISPDNGTGGGTNTNNQRSGNVPAGAITFGRRATVGLLGPWGELRLGRDYVPGFWNLTHFSPFGTNGVGSSGFLFYPVQSAARVTHVRASNSIGYFLPKMGGLYGQAIYAVGENASGSGVTEGDGDVWGVRLGYDTGPLNVAVATNKTRISSLGDLQQTNIGASYDFKVAEPMVLWNENKVGATRTRSWLVGARVPVGAGQVRVAYGRVSTSGVANDATHWALGYVHSLSKRTAVYTTYARISNKDGGTNYNLGVAPADPGGSSTGLEVGLRHSF